MNENDRTTLEQAIYEEMELTPEMIRSIRTLCGVCLCSFVESKAFKIAIVPSADRSMDTCTVCQTRRGHDYAETFSSPVSTTPSVQSKAGIVRQSFFRTMWEIFTRLR